MVKGFRGEVEGESTAELLMAVAGDDSAAYVGIERVTGRVTGRSGKLVYLHTATGACGQLRAPNLLVRYAPPPGARAAEGEDLTPPGGGQAGRRTTRGRTSRGRTSRGARMSERATASFEITVWDEQPYDEQDGIRLSRTRVVKRFRGEVEGE